MAAGVIAFEPFARGSVRSILVMIDFLASLEPPALDELAGLFRIVECPAGSAIDDRDYNCFVVVINGKANVVLPTSTADTLVLKTLQSGSFFGAVRTQAHCCGPGLSCRARFVGRWPVHADGCRPRC